MTESDWECSTDPQAMLSFLRERGTSERKLRLFAVACCRRVQDLLVPKLAEALEVAERVAEGFVSPEVRKRFREISFHGGWVMDPSTAHRRGPAKAAVSDALSRRAWDAAAGAARRVTSIKALEEYKFNGQNWEVALATQAARLAETVREILGNPLHPVPFDESWRTSDVVAIARGMYETRDFGAMPILADALQDAGCENTEVLEHCRGPVNHVRGCFVVDLVLGKM